MKIATRPVGLSVLASILAALSLPANSGAGAPSADDIAKAVQQVSDVLGFQPKKVVPSETITREGWRKWLDEELKRKVKPHEIRAQELALRLFGLVPEGFDLRKTTVDLYTEQAAAFYDSRKKKMTFVEGAPDEMAELTLPHELAHAIADQQFDLQKFLDKGAKNDDAQLARLAVAEGQATWVMFELAAKRMGQSLLTNPAMAANFAGSMADSGGGMAPVFQGAPLYIRRTLTFPYAQGLLFQQKVIEKMGKPGFEEVLRRPPSTTQQILHPEAWFENRQATEPALPKLEHAKEYRRMLEGALGEIDVALLLEQYGSVEMAQKQAPEWRGGTYALQEHKKSYRPVLQWALEWQSADSARGFLASYRKVIEGKSKALQWETETADRLKGVNLAGAFDLQVAGSVVTGIEGWTAPEK